MSDKKTEDIDGELYRILDSSGLNGGNLMDSRRSMSKIITDIKFKAVGQLRDFIKAREDRQIQGRFKVTPDDETIDVYNQKD